MNVTRLKRQGVTHVLNAAKGNSFMHVNTGPEFYASTGIIYHGIPASDTDHFDISVYFEEAADFIEKALLYKTGKGPWLLVWNAFSSLLYLFICGCWNLPETWLRFHEYVFHR